MGYSTKKIEELDRFCDQSPWDNFSKFMDDQTSKPMKIIKTGWASFDDNLGFGGFTNNIIYMLGYSGIGKTFWITNLINKLKGYKILFFSMEMGERNLILRLLMPILEKHYTDIFKYYLNNKEDFYDKVSESKIFDNLLIDYSIRSWHEMEYITNKVRPEIIIVDYLQWMTDIGSNGENESIKKNCQELARFTKDYDCNVIVLTQLRKETQDSKSLTQGIKCPSANQAYGSTFIRNTADYQFGLWRPDLTGNAIPMEANRLYCRCLKTRYDIKGRLTDIVWRYDKKTSILTED
jgi:replicative DNA helicase